MTSRTVRVTAPSRLHFGILSVNRTGTRRFGGLGAMISRPGLELVVRPAASLETAGPLAERARRVAVLAAPGDDEPQCRIEVVRAPPEHVGLGVGTQLSMAVAAGLNAFWGRPPLGAAPLARCVGRGERSAIGLHGFIHGGLLFETGKAESEDIAPLVDRIGLPSAWRFVLIRPQDCEGLSGERERRAFSRLPPFSDERTAALGEAAGRLLSAAADGRFEEFSEELYRFGYLVGQGFAAQQGGPFAGPRLTALVALIRTLGVRGVGQSSWGPTLFALLPDETSAEDFVERFRRRAGSSDLDLLIAPPDDRGATIEVAAVCPADR
jgi:beta-RFAP synthase